MAEEDEATVYGRFEDAMSRPMDEAAESAGHLRDELLETGAAGDVAAAGMNRAGSAADRLAAKQAAAARAQEASRLAALNALAAEEKVNAIRSKGVLNAQDTARVENMLAAARRDSTRAASDLARATEDLDRKQASLGRRLLTTATNVKFLERAFSGLKLVATAEVFASLVSGVSSLGVAALAAVGGLAPMVGLLGALPALGVGMLSVVGTFALITGGVGKAVKAMQQYGAYSTQAQQAMNMLGPNARAAAYEIDGYATSFKGLRDAVIGAALPYIGPTLRNVVGLLPVVQSGLQGVAGQVGRTSQELSADLLSWRPELESIMTRNTTLVGTLGHAAVLSIGIVKDVILDAGQMTQGIGDHLVNGLTRVSSWFDRNPAKIEGFFNRSLSLTLKVGHALAELGGGLVALFRGATPLSDSLGTSLENTFTTFNDWANSTEGQNRIQKFFTNAIPVVDAMGHLVMTLVHSMGELAANNGFAGMLNVISAILPPLTKMLELISKIPGANSVFAALFIANRLGVSPGLLAKATVGGAHGIGKLLRRFGGNETEALVAGEGSRLGPLGRLFGGAAGAATGSPVFVTNWPVSLGGTGLPGGLARTAEKDAESAGKVGFFAGLAAKAKGLLGFGEGATAASVGTAAASTAALVGLPAAATVGAALLVNQGVTDNRVNQSAANAAANGPVDALLEQANKWGLTSNVHWKQTYDSVVKPLILKAGDLRVLPWGGAQLSAKVLEQAAMQLRMINHKYHADPGVPYAPRFLGGSVMAGQNYMVGERGPELLASGGSMRVIGGDGAELMRPSSSGFVLPNEALRAMVAAIPNPSTRAAAAMRPEVALPVGGGGYAEASSSGGAATLELPTHGGRPVIINIYPQTEMDIERMVRAAMAGAEREQKDRQ